MIIDSLHTLFAICHIRDAILEIVKRDMCDK